MKKTILALLVLVSSALNAATCLETYQRANEAYIHRAHDLELEATVGAMTTLGAAGAWLLCVKATHALAGCSVATGLAAAVPGLYGWSKYSQLQSLEDAQTIYQVYKGEDQEIVKGFAQDVGSEQAQAIVVQLIESGELCRSSGDPMDYAEVVQMVRSEVQSDVKD